MAEKLPGRATQSAAAQERDYDGMMAAASLCYCVHKEIDQSEEIMTVVEVKGQRSKTAATFFDIPIEDEERPLCNNNMESILPGSETTSESGRPPAVTAAPSPPQPPPPPPSLVVQVMPPTPTSGPTTPFSSGASEWPKSEAAAAVEVKGQRPCDDPTAADPSDVTSNTATEVEEGGRSKQRSIIPKLTLPLIQLSTEDDEDSDEGAAAEDKSSEVEGQRQKAEEELEESKKQQQGGGGGGRGRRRRKSLVNILFRQGEESAAAAACTPTIEAPQGQRLHFRRVSEVFSLGLGMGLHRRDSKDVRSECVSPAVTPADCKGGLSIRNLFPYRRRRSSVHHLDNTEDFKESREEVMQSQRRRQSSFPPADGDEATILLEKANIIRLEKVHQDALSIQE